jgi:hypothetical protein
MRFNPVKPSGNYCPPARRKFLGGMAAVVWCKGNVYYQVVYRVAVGEKYDVPEIYTTTCRLKASRS